MIDINELFHGIVLLSGAAGALGTGYLLYSDAIVVHFSRFFKVITFGLFLFSVTAPIIVQFAPDTIHAVHALSAVFISIGLYTIVRGKIQPDDDFGGLGSDFARTDD